MGFIKRVFLFGIVNILVIVTISFTLNLLGVAPYLSAKGINYSDLLIFCLVWGMGGAFISLSLSKFMAKRMMPMKMIDQNTSDPIFQRLFQTVQKLSQAANLPKMPEVAVYFSDEVNAFATGPSKSNALVAVSEGLLRRMDWEQIEGVLGHEITHISNGDMVTMTLLQGVINALVMFIARAVVFVLSNRNRSENSSYRSNRFLVYILEVILSFLGLIVVNGFSRYREYKADAGGAAIAGREKMIKALRGLQKTVEMADLTDNKSMATLKISGGKFSHLFSTHPSLEDRLARLEQGYIR